jgi:hypothetical protein
MDRKENKARKRKKKINEGKETNRKVRTKREK